MGKASARKRLWRNRASLAQGSQASKGLVGTGAWTQWLLAMVAVMLLSASLGLIAFSVVPTVHDWSRMRQWQPAQAYVDSARLHKGGTARGGTYYAAVVRYRYAVDGVAYAGMRAAVDGSGDSWRNFHEKLVDRLLTAQRANAPISVWVNPSHPSESVVDRSLRAGPLAGELVMGLLSGSAGWWLWVMARALRRERRGCAKRTDIKINAP